MTLVVAEIVDREVRITADTELTEDRDARSGYFVAALKPVLLHPGLCVAYAGGAEDALRAIRNLGVDPHTGFDHGGVCRSLVRAHRATGDATDFLVASLVPTPSLTKISGGEMRDYGRTFVGLSKAYSAYRYAYEKAEVNDGTPAERVGRRQADAMERVIEDAAIAGVGGFCVRVAANPDGFVYLAETIIASARAEITDLFPANVPIPMPLAGTAEGGYRHALAVSEQPGIGALGIYLQPGNLGALLYPTRDLYPIWFTRLSQDAFLSEIRNQYRIGLRIYGQLDPLGDGPTVPTP